MNTLTLIAQTQSLIAAGDITGAQSALMHLADTEGDGALMTVLQQLAPRDILAIAREYDTSKESLVNLLVTPEMFAKAVVLENRYKDETHEHLRGMVNSIIFREGAQPLEFLNALGDLDGASEALANYFSEYWSRIEAFAKSGTFDTSEDYGKALSEQELLESAYMPPCLEIEDVSDKDWMELAWILRYQCPDLFSEMLLVLRAKAKDGKYPKYLMVTRKKATDDDLNDGQMGSSDNGKTTPAALDDGAESAI